MSIFERFGEPKPGEVFKKKRLESLDFIRKSVETGSDLDLEMIAVLRKVNALPFLYTTSSCEGHIYTEEEVRKRSVHIRDKIKWTIGDKTKYRPGHIMFQIDSSTQSLIFVEHLKKIILKYPNASMDENVMGEGSVNIDFDDKYKNGQFFPVEEARSMLLENRNIMNDIATLADQFISTRDIYTKTE